MLGSAHEAEDLVQETLLRAGSARAVRPGVGLGPYVAAACLRTCA
ncbi:sigma factor [Streptomyces sp. HO565]